jgi:hypothetical protein
VVTSIAIGTVVMKQTGSGRRQAVKDGQYEAKSMV